MGKGRFSSRGGRGRGRGRGRGGGAGRGQDRSNAPNFRDPGYNDGSPQGVDESVVGIRQFLTPSVAGFPGTTKERYSDFVVREVGLDGQVVRLSDVPRFDRRAANKKQQKVSEVFKQRVFSYLDGAAKSADGPEGGSHQGVISPGVRLLVGKLAGSLLGRLNRQKREAALRRDRANAAKLRKEIASIVDDATAQRLEAFVLQLVESPLKAEAVDESEAIFLFPEIADKEQRGAVHAQIRDLAGSIVVSDTVPNDEGVTVIRVRKMVVNGKKRRDVDRRSGVDPATKWPADRPDFLQFILYKRNVETHSVMQQIARAMGVSIGAISYAGTKDKRGITTQRCTIYRGSKERLDTLNPVGRELDEFNFLVGDASYVPGKLNLGDLSGNRFSLAIRGLPGDDEISDAEILRAVESWSSRGFINYFGLQRFGTKSIPTHEIGRAILQRDHKRAVDLLLQPQEGDATKIREARQLFQEQQDPAAALRALPPYLIAERAVLEGLQSHGLNAYSTALQCIPRHLRMMYTHAYQSFIWNTVTSERLANYDTDKPILGDLVLPSGVADELEEDSGDQDAPPSEDVDGASSKSKKQRVERHNSAVVVTEANIDQFTIFDVVLPLPGYDIMYPEHELKQRYVELLAADGVDFQSLHRATNSEYHLPGSFRHILKRPTAVDHEIKRYHDPSIPLLDTDVDCLMRRRAQASIPDAKLRALCLEFQLSPSSYATMAVRELLKQSSNIDAQPRRSQDVSSK